MLGVKGVKLQASVLDNQEVLQSLKSLDLGDIEALINVSGYSLNEISYIEAFSEVFPKVIIQVGFQGYPTDITDGILKLPILKSAFPGIALSLSDHADANSDFAKLAPVWLS